MTSTRKFREIEWTDHTRALHSGAMEMGAKMKPGIFAWSFLMPIQLCATQSHADAPPPQRVDLNHGTYSRRVEILCSRGDDPGDMFHIDLMRWGDERYYVAEHGALFIAEPEADQ